MKTCKVLIVGYIADVTSSYDLAFYGAGVVMMISGVMLFAIPCLKKYDPKGRSHSPKDKDTEEDDKQVDIPLDTCEDVKPHVDTL